MKVKSIIKIIVAVTLSAILLTGCALVRINPNRITVATVGDTIITLNDLLKTALPLISAYDLNRNSIDPEISKIFVDSVVNEEVQRQKMAQSGIVATDEDLANAEAQINAQLESITNQYFNLYLQDGMEVEEAAQMAYENAEAMIFTSEYTREMAMEEALFQVLTNRLREMEVKDVVVDDSEIRAAYDEAVAGDKATYAETPMSFDEDFANDEHYYVPEGVIFVRHILVAISDEDAQAIQTLVDAENNEEAAAKIQEALGKIRGRAEEVLAKAQAGEDFEALIEEYGEDPGMQGEEFKDGYILFPGFTGFVESFYEAAMSLTADGEMTGLVESDYGYHIIKRVSHEESGPIAYELREEVIRDELMKTKEEEAYTAVLEQWRTDLNVNVYMDRADYKVDILDE